MNHSAVAIIRCEVLVSDVGREIGMISQSVEMQEKQNPRLGAILQAALAGSEALLSYPTMS